MNAYEIPNLRFSLPAGGDVAHHRFVSVNADSNGIQATAASSATIIGASMNQAKSGEVLEIANGIVMVEASDTITAGTLVYTNEDGKARNAGDQPDSVVAGVAITSAVAGGLAAVKIN